MNQTLKEHLKCVVWILIINLVYCCSFQKPVVFDFLSKACKKNLSLDSETSSE